MRIKLIFISTIIFCLSFLMVSTNYALDYKDWVSLLPESINGLSKSGNPEGMNMQSGQNQWSTLHQIYSEDSRNIKITIVAGASAPQIQQFKSMPEFNMENSEQIVKSTQAAGNRAFLEISKTDNSGRLFVSAGDRTIVIFEAEPAEGEDFMISLADEVPLSDIEAKIP